MPRHEHKTPVSSHDRGLPLRDVNSSREFFPPVDYETITTNFVAELKKAAEGQPSSISFIKNEFPKTPVVRKGLVQAMVMGGTNFETVLAKITPDGKVGYVEDSRKEDTLPTFSDAVIFLKYFAKYFDPRAEAVGLNLAFPLQPLKGRFGELDGSLLYGTKEHSFKALLGKPLGQALRTYVDNDIPVSVANDTVCLSSFDADALVVGTGLGIGINIDNGGQFFVNLEAGNFNLFEGTLELDEIDANSDDPGKQRYEKMLSGTYLPLHYNLIARNKNLAVPSVANGEEITMLAGEDRGTAGDLARALLERSASLVAAQIAGIYDFKGLPEHLTFATEGGLFWHGWSFEANVQRRLEALGVPAGAVSFEKVKDSAVKGAVALLTRTS